MMDPGRFFQEHILANGVLTDQIFSYLTPSDLKNCSLVTTKWISPCRQFLRRWHPCLLRLQPKERTNIEEVWELLTDSKNIMYNGVHLNLWEVWKENGELAKLAEDVSKPILQSIIDKIPEMKHVVISFDKYYHFDHHENFLHYCLEMLPIEEIETLKTKNLDDEISWDGFLIGERVFSNLQILDINISPEDPGFTKFLERCPTLKEWCPVVDGSELRYFLSANKASVVKRLSINSDIADSLQLSKIQRAQMVLKKFEVHLEPKPEYLQLFWSIITSSFSSLEELDLALELFWPVIKSGTAPLKNVKKLGIETLGILDMQDENYGRGFEMKEKIIRDVDTKRMFPNAKIEYNHWEIKAQHNVTCACAFRLKFNCSA